MRIERVNTTGFEHVILCRDDPSGLRSIIAIHNTSLGSALGGVRMRPYPDETAALDECTELAAVMTRKAAIAGLDFGGGWSIIIGDPQQDKTEALLHAHGRAIATLGGRFIPINDVGTTQADLAVIGQETSPIALGDPSPMTALGVLEGMRACVHATGGTSLGGLRVCVQGTGNVGAALVRLLTAESAQVIVSDILPDRAQGLADETGASVAAPDEVLALPCDILAPCAVGAVVTDDTLPKLRCRIIAGGANNVLAAPDHAAELDRRGILYAPDFCINAGGLIFLEERVLGHRDEHARRRVLAVGQLISDVLDRARRDNISTIQAAHVLADIRLRIAP